jgi:hypothetical protein
VAARDRERWAFMSSEVELWKMENKIEGYGSLLHLTIIPLSQILTGRM